MFSFIFKFLFKFLFKILVFLIVLAVFILIIFNWPVNGKNEDMNFEVSFSPKAAEGLEMDWRETYLAILDDLKPRKVRLGAYWTDIEKEKRVYDFSELDWQINQARERNIGVVLAFGIKVPRWPECFIPEHYLEDKKNREDALIEYEKNLIERYKTYDNLVMWQIENEPFLPFGDCIDGAVDAEILDREIALLKELDSSRDVMVTDSGELSLWYQAAKRGDVFGTTLYRIIYKKPFGYIHYPLSPAFFRLKGLFVKYFADQDNIVIAELQAEPWGTGDLKTMSVEEQYKSMSPEKFAEIVDYAKKTKFSETYLWGAEWWYWMKEEKENDDMWSAARDLLNN